MNFQILECPKCGTAGTTQLLPWQISKGKFCGISIVCEKCDHFAIVDLRDGAEIPDSIFETAAEQANRET
jgi:hypothetical protein